MENHLSTPVARSIELKLLILLSLAFIGVVSFAWISAMDLKNAITANNSVNSVASVDISAQVEVERIRNVAESMIDSGRSYFLLGSKSFFDEQKRAKETYQEALENFEKKYSLSAVPPILKRLETLDQQHQEIFDQAMKFRQDQTESKIVGQFYNTKTATIRSAMNEALDEIAKIHKADLDALLARAEDSVLGPQVMIPRGMMWLTGSLAILFAGLSLLIVRMLVIRKRQIEERNRLYQEAKKAVQARDEVMVAVAEDLKEPLEEIKQVVAGIGSAQGSNNAQSASQLIENAELIQSFVLVAEDRIKDIGDQKRADMGNMTLRLDQLGIDAVLEEARVMMQPLAKQRDIRLQFDSVNPPTLAFYDRERVLRVLTNLVGNALKFSPRHSKVVVKARSDQQFAYISVIDSGPGIPESRVPHLFDSFWQSPKTADQGAGIGLAIVKTIVEAHGGTVTADSHGNGSTFTFSLPRRRPVGAQVGRSAAAQSRQVLRPKTTDSLQSPTVQ